jgi:hypothetical protein
VQSACRCRQRQGLLSFSIVLPDLNWLPVLTGCCFCRVQSERQLVVPKYLTPTELSRSPARSVSPISFGQLDVPVVTPTRPLSDHELVGYSMIRVWQW